MFIPVGDGNIISGIHKGFKDLQDLGWLDQMPRLFGVQAEDRRQSANAFLSADVRRSSRSLPIQLPIAFRSICPGMACAQCALPAQTGGAYLTVADEDILKAIAELGKVGIFAEPAGATAYAGLVKAVQNGFDTPG